VKPPTLLMLCACRVQQMVQQLVLQGLVGPHHDDLCTQLMVCMRAQHARP
jgi:hypothetical protein